MVELALHPTCLPSWVGVSCPEILAATFKSEDAATGAAAISKFLGYATNYFGMTAEMSWPCAT